MQVSTHVSRRVLVACAAGSALAAFHVQAAQVIATANADVEVREVGPELTRGFGTTGPATELTLNNNPFAGSNRNVDVIRFSLPAQIQTAADIENFAELRVFFRSQSIVGGQNGVMRVYGLNPTTAHNQTWDETNTFYRDTGNHQIISPLNGTGQTLQSPSPISQPANPVNVAAGAPAAPFPVAAGYGANTADSRRAPGIRYEDAPYSAQVATENAARKIYNDNLRAIYDNSGGTTGGAATYLPYFNQPAYNVSKTQTLNGLSAISVGDGNPATTGDGIADLYSDVLESNRPFYSGATDSWVDDVLGDSTLLGFAKLRLSATIPNGEGYYLPFGGVRTELLTGALPADIAQYELDAAAFRANLVAYLAAGLGAGQRDFSFLIGQGINNVDGLLPGELQGNVNLNFASKEYTPVNTALGGQGAFAAQLVLAPEPGSFTLIGLAAAGMFARRRRA